MLDEMEDRVDELTDTSLSLVRCTAHLHVL